MRFIRLLIWYLGRRFKFIRMFAWRHDWRVTWGIHQWLEDGWPVSKTCTSQSGVLTKKKLEEFYALMDDDVP